MAASPVRVGRVVIAADSGDESMTPLFSTTSTRSGGCHEGDHHRLEEPQEDLASGGFPIDLLRFGWPINVLLGVPVRDETREQLAFAGKRDHEVGARCGCFS